MGFLDRFLRRHHNEPSEPVLGAARINGQLDLLIPRLNSLVSRLEAQQEQQKGET